MTTGTQGSWYGRLLASRKLKGRGNNSALCKVSTRLTPMAQRPHACHANLACWDNTSTLDVLKVLPLPLPSAGSRPPRSCDKHGNRYTTHRIRILLPGYAAPPFSLFALCSAVWSYGDDGQDSDGSSSNYAPSGSGSEHEPSPKTKPPARSKRETAPHQGTHLP